MDVITSECAFSFFILKLIVFSFFGKGVIFRKQVSSDGNYSLGVAFMNERALAITSVECDIVIRIVYKSYDKFKWKKKHIYI